MAVIGSANDNRIDALEALMTPALEEIESIRIPAEAGHAFRPRGDVFSRRKRRNWGMSSKGVDTVSIRSPICWILLSVINASVAAAKNLRAL